MFIDNDDDEAVWKPTQVGYDLDIDLTEPKPKRGRPFKVGAVQGPVQREEGRAASLAYMQACHDRDIAVADIIAQSNAAMKEIREQRDAYIAKWTAFVADKKKLNALLNPR
jgi:hypothetical protein